MIRTGLIALMLAMQGPAPATNVADWFAPSDISPTGLVCDPPAAPPKPVIPPADALAYARQWQGAGEPSLYALSKDPAYAHRKEYRFTYVRAFDPPYIVRVSQDTSGVWTLVGKQLAARSATSPWIVGDHVERKFTETDGRNFAGHIAAARLDQLNGGECARGVDGAAWIFEALEDGRYRLFFRHSPDSGPIRDLGLTMLNATGWAVEPIY